MKKSFADLRKDHIARSIADNPTDITITRITKVRSAGGFADNTSTVGPFTVRIAQTKASQRDISEREGHKQEQEYTLLADAVADIQSGPLVTDSFEVAGLGRFEVVNVVPQIVKGEKVGLQAEIKRVK